MYPTDKDFPTKEECNTNEKKNNKASSSSRPWAGDRDPRIIRASRSFGGKDRHSKVCTVKGLRDRRIRLSMPTAIQLYDLQDRLGLNQPSKVVDWLLNAAKHEIDKLPPLQIPQGNFGQYLQSIVASHECVKDNRAHTSLLSSKEGIKINNRVDGEDHQTTIPKSTYWSLNSRADQCGEGGRESTIVNKNWIKRNEDQEQEQEDDQEGHRTQVSSNQVSPPGMVNNALPDTSYNHWEPSYLSLSHSRNQGYSYQIEDPHNYNYNVLPLPSSLSLPSGSQILLCPATTQSFFTPYVTTPVDCDPRQMNHFQMLSSSSQNFLPNSLTPSLYSINPPPMRPLQLSITPKLLHPQNNNGNQSNKVNNGDTSNTSTSDFFQTDPKASF